MVQTLKLKDEFKGVDLGDERLNERCMELVKGLGQHPDKSIPKSCDDWASIKGAYRFFRNDNVTREALEEPHIHQTVRRCEGRADVAAIQDTTYVNYTTHHEAEDLGPIGTAEGLQGMVVHNTIAVDVERKEVLGLLGQAVWVRKGHHPKGETSVQRRERERESKCWVRGIHHAESLGLSSPLHVMDREGDIYEVLASLREGKRYVIRGSWNRAVLGEQKYLFESVRKSPVVGKMDVKVPRRAGQRKRVALVTLRRCHETIRPPVALRRQGDDIPVHLVEAYEERAPKGMLPLHWILLTSEPVETKEDCIRVMKIYKCRWKIEEFHKSLKTGCGIEKRQLRTEKRLEAVLGFYSVVGMMLLRIREAARDESRKARDYFSPAQLTLLRSKVRKLEKDPTAREAFRAIAQIGGFIGRKSDGEPGWKTLWLGMNELLTMEQGYYLSQKISYVRRAPKRCG